MAYRYGPSRERAPPFRKLVFMPLQILSVMLLAACVAGHLNRGIYTLAYHRRWVSPWSPAPEGVARRTWRDRIPVVGWWFLRREESVHGANFWIRPALIEACFILVIGGLYAFELSGGLLPIGSVAPPADVLRWQFINHACLVAIMVMATFIDLDEKRIPDEITVTGTIAAVCLAAVAPDVALPAWTTSVPPIAIAPLRLTTPDAWRPVLAGPVGWWVSMGCIVSWWYALLPKTLWYRGGARMFCRYLGASLWRRFPAKLSALMLAVAAGTTFIWWLGGAAWQAVLSAWVGLAVAGAIVWLVRIVGSAALAQEAMGFGDVTLLGMIGAFLGWQPALLVFFFAPFTGAILAIGQWLLTRRKDIAYGPFLCLAAALLILTWAEVWPAWGLPVFQLGGLIPLVLLFGLALMGALLWLIQRVKRALTSR